MPTFVFRTVLSLSAVAASMLSCGAVALDKPALATVAVRGEDGASQKFDAQTLAQLPQHTVTAQAHGKNVTCDGVNVSDVLAKVGAPQGEALRGRALTLYVRVSAADGYRVVYSLAELDPAMHDNVPILTSHCDGAALDAKDGPFRIISPGEKRPARWIRQVTAIDLLRAP